MQTERVTFLTSAEHKAALDAFAASHGISVGHLVREASREYVARAGQVDEGEEALAMILPELERAAAKWSRQIDAMEASIDKAIAAVDAVLHGDHR